MVDNNLTEGSGESTPNQVSEELHRLDSNYIQFPTFEDWSKQTSVDPVRWDRYMRLLASAAEENPDVLAKAREVAKRAAAIDTGAIEGLYEVDRGFTFTVAYGTVTWDSLSKPDAQEIKAHFEAQLDAYDYVLDLATSAEPFSAAAIRELHKQVCRAQEKYTVVTSVGEQKQQLPKGVYKTQPNHVITGPQSSHSYAPVDMTGPEMARLLQELQSESFQMAHPVIQAAYVHYCLVVIHPFADGNGRVARALASAYMYRATSTPIVILVDQKDGYINSLQAADSGNYQLFVEFMLNRCLDTLKLINNSIQCARVPSLDETLSEIKRLYVTKGGYEHAVVDQAGWDFLKAVVDKVGEQITSISGPRVSGKAVQYEPQYNVSDPAFRMPVSGGKGLHVQLQTPLPAKATVNRSYLLWIPRDAGLDDDLLLIRHEVPADFVSCRIDEIYPRVSTSLHIGINLFAERIIREMLNELAAAGYQALGPLRRTP